MLDLQRYNRICIDTQTFIYFIEENLQYLQKVEPIFQEISEGNVTGVSSYLSLLEVLVKPIKEGNVEIASQYRDFMLSSVYLKLYPLDDEVAEIAATLRAKYSGNGLKLRTPDAIQIATGILAEADVFITNDKQLKQISEIEVVVLEEN
jgi:predicted nucleic acid-binding protein